MKQYLDLLEKVLKEGEDRPDRTGTGVRSIFGAQFRHSLDEGFPLLTTKKLHWKSIVHELLWFIRGDTNVKYLHDHGVTIWDEWADPHGDLGPIYGKQWRRWTKEVNYFGTQSVDQLSNVIESIKSNPYGRRHIVSAWNVGELDKMALPPCHMMFQFYVSLEGKLSLHMYQRSADIFLGVPFNIASYALLLNIVARATDLVPGELIVSFGDLHLYHNHFKQAEEQLAREPKNLPYILVQPIFTPPDLNTLKEKDIVLVNYHPSSSIKAQIAV
jgi:thymidylate synthase